MQMLIDRYGDSTDAAQDGETLEKQETSENKNFSHAEEVLEILDILNKRN